jgi:hypothetical protein
MLFQHRLNASAFQPIASVILGFTLPCQARHFRHNRRSPPVRPNAGHEFPDKNWAFRILPGSFDGSVRRLGCLSAMDRGVRTRIRLAAQPPLAFSRSAAVAFAYRPGHRDRFSVNDWRRRFAAPGHGIACDGPRHARLVYYSVFVTSGFAPDLARIAKRSADPLPEPTVSPERRLA